MFCIVGDAFDRFLSRVYDMRNAVFIVKQCLLFFVFFGLCTIFFSYNVDLVIETVIYIFYMF